MSVHPRTRFADDGDREHWLVLQRFVSDYCDYVSDRFIARERQAQRNTHAPRQKRNRSDAA